MTLITWSDRLSVGVRVIDSQHGALMDIINELHEAMLRGQAENFTAPLLWKLIAYTNDHFSAEEALLARAEYPELEGHKKLHHELIQKVEHYALRFERGEIELSPHLMNFLRDWLTNHIQNADKAYAPCLAETHMN